MLARVTNTAAARVGVGDAEVVFARDGARPLQLAVAALPVPLEAGASVALSLAVADLAEGTYSATVRATPGHQLLECEVADNVSVQTIVCDP